MTRASLIAGGLVIVAVAVVFSVTGRPSGGTQVSLIISGGTVVTMNTAGEVIADGAVAIDGARIVAVGPTDAILKTYSAARRLDATGRIVLPGLVNTHTHAPMVLYRGLADDLALMDWLTQYIVPAEKATVSPEMVRVGTQLAALEMVESGTTTFADMYYFEETIAQATADAGMRGVLGQTIIRFPVADAATPEEGLARTERFLREWAGHELITPAVAPHAPYTLTPETLRATRTLADKYRVPVLIHLAETKDEVATIAAEQQATPTMFLDRIGFWNGPSVAAHAVWVDEADLQVLVSRGVGLSHNPESNMKLSSGTARVPAWLAAGAHAG
ncbi:MAG: amidohydrolase family protein, partial [Acidobacteria bacterium]|nr:amidohydrolase family protein [Acidobacteriota bacterium]